MQLKFSLILSIVALASQVSASSQQARAHKDLARALSIERRGGGSGAPGTYYDDTTGEVACGGFYHPHDMIVAMNSPDFAGGSACGKSITIQYQGKTAHATVVDECSTCGPNGIDMSQGLFTTFASTSVGEIYLNWFFGSAPEPTPTKTPPPPPPPKPTTTSHKTTSTHTTSTLTTHHSSYSSSSSTSTSTSSASAVSSLPPISIPSGPNNIASILQAYIEIGELLTFGANAGYSGN